MIGSSTPKLRGRGREVAVALAAALVLMFAGARQAAAGPTRGASASKPGNTAKQTEDESLYSCGKAHGRVAVNFKPQVQLHDLITWAMGFTCKNFIFSSGIGGRSARVTIIAPKRMSARQAWRLFLVALQNMNLTVVPKGNVLEVVEAPQAKTKPLPVRTKGYASSTDQIVRALIRPQHLQAQDLATVLDAFKSKDGEIKAIPSADIVVVTDYGNNINKMQSIIRAVDQPATGERLYMIQVKYADATDLAQKLQQILSGNARTSNPRRRPRRRRGRRRGVTSISFKGASNEAVPSKIVADERTNSLILLASEPAYLRTRALVKALDVEVNAESEGGVHVYYLENADAKKMATTLQTVISGVSAGGNRRGHRRRRVAPQSNGGADAFEGPVRVTADQPTNSLVIVASVKDYLSLRDVIRKLDVPRPQVYIEASIVEVTVNHDRKLGTSFYGGDALNNGSILFGGVQHSNLSSLATALDPKDTLPGITGLMGGALGPLLPGAEQLLGLSIPSYGVLFQALATSSDVNTLSTPHILTSDNQEADLLVGENIPYIAGGTFGLGSGQGGQTGGSFFPVQNVQRQDVALNLKITPQINASDLVKLKIDLEISNIASPNFNGLGPSWTKRTIKDTVVVQDQQSVVIGGLMSDRVTTSESKIPLLGDIPLLGYLFKYKEKSKAKTSLLVLLTPYIVKDQMDVERIVERRIREQREFIDTFSDWKSIKYRPAMNYARKRGVVEEINRAVEKVQKNAQMMQQMNSQQVQVHDGPIKVDDTSGGNSGDQKASTDAAGTGGSAVSGAGTGNSASGAGHGGSANAPAASPRTRSSGRHPRRVGHHRPSRAQQTRR